MGLGDLFFLADVIATQEVNKIMNDVRDYNYELLQRAKLDGLSKLRLFLDMTYTDKLIGYDLFEDIPAETHCELMSGQIKTYKQILESKLDNKFSDKYYSYLVQIIDNKETERTTYIIDSIYDQ
ncbi:hypothetical protein ACSTS3_04670 [Aquimarina muelleri]|uniref:hypothetical protein n=1 Tax=Aquimarina muelleri TaxID=279356 RepID=UPI003F685390